MNFLISSILGFLLAYKYFAIFGITFLAALIAPLPSNISLVSAGAFAEQGYMNMYAIIAVALLGNVCGDLLGFFIARRYGKRFLIKIGLRRMIESAKYRALEKYFVDRVGLTIFITRFTTEFGPLMNILMGLSEVPFKKYFLYEFTGEFFDVLVFSIAGYILGTQWEGASHIINFAGIAVVGIIVAVMLAQYYMRGIKKHMEEEEKVK